MVIERSYMPEETLDEPEIEVEIGPEEEIVDAEPEEPEHSANLVEFLTENELTSISSYLLECFEADEASRKEWLKSYTDGLDYLGFKSDDRVKPFKGASGVFHPVLAEAVVRFQSNAIIEIFPAAGPVLTKVVGDESYEKMAQAQRIKEELNYQLTENICDYRSETEKLLFRLPLAGSVFKKVYFDPMTKKPSAKMVPAEDFVIDYGCSDITSSERYTHVMRRSKNEVKKLQRSGFYASVDLGEPEAYFPEGKEKEDKITGIKQQTHKGVPHTLLEFHVHYNLPGAFEDPDGVADPYVITIDKTSSKVLSIYRNWDEADDNRNPEQYFVHYEYMPGLGFYGTGLINLIGSIAKGSTAILRQLIDAGTLANLPGGLKTRGLRTKNGEMPIQPGEWRDADVPGGNLRENLFPLPYKEPSATLVNLLGTIVEEGRRIGSIAEIDIGSGSENAPVGTTLALMERSLKVMSAVHARLHASLRRELKLICRIIADYMPPRYEWDESGQFDRSSDFDARVDVLPVSDPNAATQAQRIVQLQAVMQLIQQNPEIYNIKEAHREALQIFGVKNDERILPRDQDPIRLDPVSENMNMLTSQPVKVYPDQDHAAHLQVHISAMMDPKIMEMVGQSSNAQRLLGAMEAHIAEHLAHQYRAEIQEELGVQLPPLGEELPPEVEARLSRLVAEAGTRLREAHKQEMEQQKAEEIAADPVFQLREREVAIKEQDSLHKRAKESLEVLVDIAEKATKEAIDLRRIESEEVRAGAKIGADLVTFGAQLEADEREQGVELGKEVTKEILSHAQKREQLRHDADERAKDRVIEARKATKKTKT